MNQKTLKMATAQSPSLKSKWNTFKTPLESIELLLEWVLRMLSGQQIILVSIFDHVTSIIQSGALLLKEIN